MKKNKKTALVLGGGISSLAVSSYLAYLGFKVILIEKNNFLGGRASFFKEKGYLFDKGPSWYMMPEVFDEFFSFFNKKTSDYYRLVRLPINYWYKNFLIDYAKKEFALIKRNLEKEKIVEIKNIDIFFDFLIKGKFIRSYLIKKFFDFYKKKEDDFIVNQLTNIALSIEIFHSSILIHDDVFDNDYLRRKDKTIFYKYNDLYKKEKNNEFGKNLAIILGDLGFYLSNFLFKGVDNHQNKNQILNTFFTQVIKTSLGEFLDVKTSLLNINIGIKKINLINRLKTSEYTFNLPFKLGYFLAIDKVDEKELKLIEKIGFIMGDIFQIKDDLLNFLGDSKITGKSVGTDIQENKNTVIKKYFLKI